MIVYGCFSRINNFLGRTETRTHDRMTSLLYCQTIRTVRDISQDDQARIATCSLRTPTDRLTDLRWLSTCEISCASSVSDSFCRVDTALTETVCEFLSTVESRLADRFLSRGYGRDVCLSDNLRVLSATSKRFYSARNCRQFQHVVVHSTTL